MKTFKTKQREKAGGLVKLLFTLLIGTSLVGLAQETAPIRTADELDVLLAPIALYPDDLIAVMLSAATAPGDIVLAAHYNAAGGDVAQLNAQPWDDSVRTLAHYPELTQWMSDNLEWTRVVGEAFRNQPADVLAAIQRLRAKAQALGNLTTTAQQRVINDQNTIEIAPANPEVIYVPQYDPQLVYLEPAPLGCSWISFGFCWQLGDWHRYDFDWRRCDVRVRERQPQWRYPVEVIHAWHPTQSAARPNLTNNRPAAISRTHPIAVVSPPHTAATSQTIPIRGQLYHQQPQIVTPAPAARVNASVPSVHQNAFVRGHGEVNHSVYVPPPQVQPDAVHSVLPPTPHPAVIHSAPTLRSWPQHEATVHMSAPVVSQPSHREPARQEIRFTQNPAPMVRQNAPAAQPPRVRYERPATAQPANHAEYRAPQPAGNNLPSSGDHNSGGHWGSFATRHN